MTRTKRAESIPPPGRLPSIAADSENGRFYAQSHPDAQIISNRQYEGQYVLCPACWRPLSTDVDRLVCTACDYKSAVIAERK